LNSKLPIAKLRTAHNGNDQPNLAAQTTQIESSVNLTTTIRLDHYSNTIGSYKQEPEAEFEWNREEDEAEAIRLSVEENKPVPHKKEHLTQNKEGSRHIIDEGLDPKQRGKTFVTSNRRSAIFSWFS
jgi:hypothetical protein